MTRKTFLAVVVCCVGFLPAAVVRSSSDGQPGPFDACEQTVAADPDGWKSCSCFYRVAIGHGLYDEARERLEQHRRTSDNPCLPFNLGRLHLLLGRLQEAEPLLTQAAAGYEAQGPQDGEVYARINLADVLIQLDAGGESALSQLDRARQVAEEMGNHVLLAEALLKEARWLAHRGGDYGDIETTLHWIRREAFADAHYSLRRDTLLTLGELLHSRGRFVEAEKIFEDAVDDAIRNNDLYGEASLRNNHAASVGAQAPTPEIRARVEGLLSDTLTAAVAIHNPFAELEARRRLGRLAGGGAGRQQLQLALDLAEAHRHQEPKYLAWTLGNWAASLLTDDPNEARTRIDEASEIFDELTGPWPRLYGWSDHLAVLWATAPRHEALAAADELLQIAADLELAQGTESARLQVSAVWTEISQWLVGKLLLEAVRGADTVAQAFARSEGLRSRLLLDSLIAGGVGPAVALDSRNRSDLLRVEGDITALHRRLLDPSLKSEQRQKALNRLAELEQLEDRLVARQRRLRGESLAAGAPWVGLDQLQTTLQPDEAVLAYHLGYWQALDGSFKAGSWLLSISADETRIYRLPGQGEIDPAVEVFVHLFARADSSEAVPASALFDTLLADALADLPRRISKLIIIPDGSLFRLPFATLRAAADQPPLAARYTLFQVPSITVWQRLREIEVEGRLTVAAADPVVPFTNTTQHDAQTRNSPWTSGLVLPALPHARREGRSALRHLGRPGRLLLGDEADEATIKQLGKKGLRLLHLGAHAVLDETHPQRSAIVLSAGAGDQDGLLRPREAATLDLQGAVVVLATCQSARGTVLQGEGALSLTRAFLEGGASVVVGSLWPLDDRQAANVFDRFYRHLGRGESVARALASAQRQSHDRGVPAAAWAGLVVYGNGDVVLAADQQHRKRVDGAWAWVLGCLAISLGMAMLHTAIKSQS